MKIVSWEFESPPLHTLYFIVLGGNSSVGRARPCQGRGRGSESRLPLNILNKPSDGVFLVKAQVAELVDAHVSGACASRRAGSSPVLGTIYSEYIFMLERWRNW